MRLWPWYYCLIYTIWGYDTRLCRDHKVDVVMSFVWSSSLSARVQIKHIYTSLCILVLHSADTLSHASSLFEDERDAVFCHWFILLIRTQLDARHCLPLHTWQGALMNKVQMEESLRGLNGMHVALSELECVCVFATTVPQRQYQLLHSVIDSSWIENHERTAVTHVTPC